MFYSVQHQRRETPDTGDRNVTTKKWTGLAVRTSEATIRAFDARAELHGKNRSDMLHELINAFNEGRLTIHQPSRIKKANEGLYK